MSVTEFAFQPPNSAGIILYTYLPLTYAKCILYLVFTLQNPSPCSYISERRPQSHWTARLNYWVTETSLWLSLKQCKRKKSRSCHLCSPSLTPDCEPSSYISPQTPHGGGRATVLAAWVYCVPFSASWEFRSLFYFLQTLSPDFLFGFTWQRKPRFWPAAILVLGYCQPCCPEKKGARVIVNSDLLWV